MPLTLGEIAVRYGCELRGDPDLVVDRVANLADAQPGTIAFLANPRFRPLLERSRAGAIVLGPDDAEACSVPALISANPYLVFAGVAAQLHPPPPLQPGMHHLASVADDCQLPDSCEVAAGAVIETGVRLGERVLIGPNAVICRGAIIGDDTRVLAGVVVCHDVHIGARCLLHPGAVIGSDGFGNARDTAGAWTKVPQLGRVVVGDDVEIGANTTIDRGAIGDTRIHDGVRLDNLIHIAHNVSIGAHTAIAAQAGVAGSSRVGARCMIGGHAAISDHVEVADDVVLLGATMVTGDIRKPGAYGGPANSADEILRWRRNAARFRQLDDMARRLKRLERRQQETPSDD
jgi:UDP-3-O-[3-hydroxymyristoyl] glucosamine N-acyltransferase